MADSTPLETGRLVDLGLKPNYQPHDDRLHDFYVPALKCAVTYDRLVGYWQSSSLAIAAAGLPYFIRNAVEQGGRMRIIAGARLAPKDVEAIREGEPLDEVVAGRLIKDPPHAEELVVQERLRLLAWMVREGLLEIKIGLPTDDQGMPMKAAEAEGYFHTKFGIITDHAGDRVLFEGSVNESASGWKYNHEAFTVYQSWEPLIWERFAQPWVETFERHWNHPDPVKGWAILDLPDAVERDFIDSTLPDDWTPPEFDPEEPIGRAVEDLHQLAEAPAEDGGTGVGFVTLPIEPWPHQSQIASRILETWPRSYLLADEVGLGKTIEAGLVVRELLLTGKAERILLMVPASVQRQWQEELYEKFCLDVPSYKNGKFTDYDGESVDPEGLSPWGAFPFMLVSSHLARMRSQRRAILSAQPWDLVFVDEAHHARRRGAGGTESANQLLQLLRELRDAHMWKALLLATATPMQMNTHEIYDLLDLFGLPGRWGEAPDNFDRYYRQLNEPDPKAREWEPLRLMLGDYLRQPDVEPSQLVMDRVRQLQGPSRMRIEQFHRTPFRAAEIASWPDPVKGILDYWLRANTPIRDRVYRTSREALRMYQEDGILSREATIPRREVRDRMIRFESDAESELYQRIEAYITRFYEQYNKDKATKPLGFIMTVYRRRLTSSLYAIHESLKRRLANIQGAAAIDDLLDDDDKYALENLREFDFDDLSDEAAPYAEEIGELQSFIDELEKAIPHDTKAQKVADEIFEAFAGGHRTVVVFTQFTDTLEWLRDQLVSTYKSSVACYTGNGGSRYNPDTETWDPVSKEVVKELFRAGDEVRILLGTDSMSEGLNLQTCDKLINYDMPWNFMRVEQRIGRIDRIGGQPTVHISNYFYEDTVEEQVYSGIKEDAEWFHQVVGPAQPVLGEVESVLQKLAMQAPGAARDQALELELDNVRKAIEDYHKRPVTLGTLEADEPPPTGGYGTQPVIDLDEIERRLLENPLASRVMHSHPDFERTYLVEIEGEKHPMTFDREVYDREPDIGFMTYGNPVFDLLLEVTAER